MANQQTTYVALLRGVNVGGKTIISMAKLKECFTGLGYSEVTTYINSGNVIFRTTPTDPRLLETTIEKAIVERFSHQIVVIVRSFKEMQQLIGHIPNSWRTAADQKRNIIFLRHTIDNPDILKNLAPKPGIEELHYHPGVLFWSANTSSLTKSNMLKVNKMPIYQEMTIRIFNSAYKIYEMMRRIDENATARMEM